MPAKLRTASAVLWVALLAGCAAEIPLAPAHIAGLDHPAPDLRMAATLRVELPNKRARALAEGSVWHAVGSLPQGTVYQPVGTVFMIVDRNVHEAYLVVHDGALLGFYLPGEGRYMSLAAPLSLPTRGASR